MFRNFKLRQLSVLPALFLTATLGLSSCSNSTGNPDPEDQFGQASDNFDRNAMLSNFATTIILPAYQDFSAAADTLAQACEAHASSIRNGDADQAQRLAAAQTAFNIAMDNWQTAEMFQVGPAGSSASIIGGQDIRERIYSWPSTSSCRVDQELVEGRFLTAQDFAQGELVNVFGLDALRQLLFDQDNTNNCGPNVGINTNGSWDNLVQSGDLPLRRAEYAANIARTLANDALLLFRNWSPANGNFVAQLSEAGTANSTTYTSAQQAVNEIYFGLFYLEKEVKDLKLGLPLGVTSANGVQADLVESEFAGRSLQNILVNLRTFQRFFLGNRPNETAAVGFDDFLIELGATSLEQTMRDDLTAAIATLEALNDPLRDELTNNQAAVQNAFTLLKRVTDNLKGQFPTVLNLRVPAQGAGDND